MNAGEELAWAEGFGHIVIAAGVQPYDAVHHRILGGQEQDGHVGGAANGPANVDAFEFRHEDVEQNEVGCIGLGDIECHAPVRSFQHFETRAAYRERYDIADVRIVVNDKDFAGTGHRSWLVVDANAADAGRCALEQDVARFAQHPLCASRETRGNPDGERRVCVRPVEQQHEHRGGDGGDRSEQIAENVHGCVPDVEVLRQRNNA